MRELNMSMGKFKKKYLGKKSKGWLSYEGILINLKEEIELLENVSAYKSPPFRFNLICMKINHPLDKFFKKL